MRPVCIFFWINCLKILHFCSMFVSTAKKLRVLRNSALSTQLGKFTTLQIYVGWNLTGNISQELTATIWRRATAEQDLNLLYKYRLEWYQTLVFSLLCGLTRNEVFSVFGRICWRNMFTYPDPFHRP